MKRLVGRMPNKWSYDFWVSKNLDFSSTNPKILLEFLWLKKFHPNVVVVIIDVVTVVATIVATTLSIEVETQQSISN
jgi:hypothetical protein